MSVLRKTTLKDIAQEMGVSINTVSHALRDMPDISSETKATIKEKANSMGYYPNFAASALRTNRSMAIGVVVSDISNPIFSDMVKGIDNASKAAGYSLLLANTNENYEEEVIAIENMQRRNVDGIILFPSMIKEGTVKTLLKNKIHFVLAGRRFSNIKTNVVMNDDFYGGYLAAEHLYNKGHRKFLYITGPLYISSSKDRLDGFQKCIHEKGLQSDAIDVCECEVSWIGSYNAMNKLLEKEMKATAIFAFSDFMAIGILRALHEHNLSVPKDIAIMGYDDIDYCELVSPSLTTISMSKFLLGKYAAEMLFRKISNPEQQKNEFQQEIIKPSLIMRNST